MKKLLFLIILTSFAFGQSKYYLPFPIEQSNGRPLNNKNVVVYPAGTEVGGTALIYAANTAGLYYTTSPITTAYYDVYVNGRKIIENILINTYLLNDFRDVIGDSVNALSTDNATTVVEDGKIVQKVFKDTTALKLADIDSVGKVVYLKEVANGYGGGEFVYTTESLVPDGGTVFAVSGGGYLQRRKAKDDAGHADITWWGAVPDGAIADTARNSIALQAAFDHVDSTRSNRGEVYIPAGHYKFNRSIITRGTEPYGDVNDFVGYFDVNASKGSVLEYTGDTTAIQIGLNLVEGANGYITFRNLYLIGQDSTSTLNNKGIDIVGTGHSDIKFENMAVDNFAVGITMNDATSFSMENIHIRRCGTGIAAGYKTDHFWFYGNVTNCTIGVHIGYIDTRYSPTPRGSYTQNWMLLANGNNLAVLIGGNGSNNITFRNSYIENSNRSFEIGHNADVWGQTEANWINSITFDGVHIADISGARVTKGIEIYTPVLKFNIINSYYTLDSGIPSIHFKTESAKNGTSLSGEFDGNYILEDSLGNTHTMSKGFRWNSDMDFAGDGFMRLTHVDGDPSPSLAKSGEVMIDTSSALMNAQVLLLNKSDSEYWYNLTPLQSEHYFYGNDFHPLHNNFVSTYAERDTISENFSKIVYKFDDTSDEYIAADFVVRDDYYNSDSIYADIYWYSEAATSGNVSWGFQFNRHGLGETVNSTSPVSTIYRSRATDGTAKNLNITTIGQLTTNLAAGDICKVILRRDGDGSSGTDSMTGDAVVVALKIRYGKR